MSDLPEFPKLPDDDEVIFDATSMDIIDTLSVREVEAVARALRISAEDHAGRVASINRVVALLNDAAKIGLRLL